MRGRVHALAASFALALVAFAGPVADRSPAAESAERIPVILFVFDELPTVSLLKGPGVIDRKRFPNFSRLSRDATWYPNHTTSSQFTVNSLPTLLTGRRVAADGKTATYGNYPFNLFSLLRWNGYSQEIREFTSELCPQEFCALPEGEIGAEQDITDPWDFIRFKIRSRFQLVRELFPRWLDSRSFGTEFLFAHSFLPHEPYYYLPGGQRYQSGAMPRLAEGGLGRILDSKAAAGQALQRQQIQLARVDELLGNLRRRIHEAGLWNRAMVIVTSDHGSSFRSGSNRRTIHKRNVASIAHAPLFIKYPGQKRGGPDPTRTQEVDILPTIAETVGVDPFPGMDGMPISKVDDPWRPANVDGLQFGRGLLERRLEMDLNLKRRMLGERGIWQMGPKAGLIGRKIPPASKKRTGKPALSIDNRKEFSGVRPAANWIPAMIYGRSTKLKPGTVLALGLNGRIAGTARVFEDGGLNRFGTVVNPKLLRKVNRVTVNLVRGGRLGRRIY